MTELEIVEGTETVLTADELENQGLTPIEPDKKVETVIPEEKKEGIVEEKKESLFDKFKKPEEKEQIILTDEQKAEQLEKETFKAKVIESDEYKAILGEVSQLKSDGELSKSEIQKYKDNALAKLFDKDLTEIDVKEFGRKLIGEDLSKLSEEELLTRDIKARFSKLSGDDLDAAIQDELLSFQELRSYEQKQKLAEILETLEKSQPENDVLKIINELKDKTAETNVPDPNKYLNREEVNNRLSEISSEYDKIGKKFIGQDYLGYIVKEDDIPLIKGVFEGIAKDFSVDKSWIRDFKAAIFDKAVVDADERGYQRGLIEKANPSRNDTTATVLQVKETGKGIATATDEDIKNIP